MQRQSVRILMEELERVGLGARYGDLDQQQAEALLRKDIRALLRSGDDGEKSAVLVLWFEWSRRADAHRDPASNTLSRRSPCPN